MTKPFDFKREDRVANGDGADQMRLAEPAAALVRPSSGVITLDRMIGGLTVSTRLQVGG
jgi:hypothetical protein